MMKVDSVIMMLCLWWAPLPSSGQPRSWGRTRGERHIPFPDTSQDARALVMMTKMMKKDPSVKKSCKDKKGKGMKGMQMCGSPKPSRSPTMPPSPTPILAPSPTPIIAPSPSPTFAPSPIPLFVPSVAPSVVPTPAGGGCTNVTLVSNQGKFYTILDMPVRKLSKEEEEAEGAIPVQIDLLDFADDEARDAFGKQLLSDASRHGAYVGLMGMPYLVFPESTVAEARWTTDTSGNPGVAAASSTAQLDLTFGARPLEARCLMAAPSIIEH